ncbi:MAG: hypothetical protein M1336_05120 [Deltaproteobacteria bacterium]|jgi:hypothetical protein|nr:hypothetical protein [Deltaproteobacteria bacterium]
MTQSSKGSWRRSWWPLAAVVVLGIAAFGARAQAAGTQVERNASRELSQFLRQHALPLVGAQVLLASDGTHQVLLYGFVASDDERKKAEHEVQSFLGQSNVTITDRIAVRPELKELGHNAGAQGAAPAQAAAEPVTLDRVLDQIQRYGIRPAPDLDNVPPP